MIILLLISILLILKKYEKKNYPPGPRGLPIIGSLLNIDAKVPYKSLTKLSEIYGPIFGMRMGSVYTVVLSDPKLIRTTLAKDEFSGRAPLYLTHGIMNGYGKSCYYYYCKISNISSFTLTGIICAEGELWKEQRKFVSATLKNFGAVKHSLKKDIMENNIKKFSNEAIQVIVKFN